MKKLKLLLFMISTFFIINSIAMAVLPPANSEIGTQASLQYVSGTGVNRTVLSNTVITIINPFYGVEITPDNDLFGKLHETVYFIHQVKNTGNIVESYLPTYVDESEGGEIGFDAVTFLTAEGGTTIPLTDGVLTIEPGETKALIVMTKNDPSMTGTGAVGYLKVVVNTTTPTLSQKDTVGDTLTITQGPVINGYKITDIPNGPSGSEIEYTLSFLNVGGDDGTDFIITDTLDSNLIYTPGSTTIEVDNTGGFVAIGDGATVGTITLNVSGQTITITKTDGVKQQAVQGNTSTANFKVKFKVTTALNLDAQVISNIASFEYNNSAGSDLVDNQSTNGTNFEIDGYSSFTFVGDTLLEGEQGQMLLFSNLITNTGNVVDSFDISLINDEFPTGTQFFLAHDGDGDQEEFTSRVPLIDNTGSGIVDTGILAVGESKHILLWVQLPREAKGSNFRVTKHGESGFDKFKGNDPVLSRNAIDTVTTINPAVVDLTNDDSLANNPNAPGKGMGPEAAPVTQIQVTPGTSGYFGLYINNLSQYLTDEYTIEASTDPTFATLDIPEGMTVRFETSGGTPILTSGSILPGESLNIKAVVDITTSAQAGNISVYFRVKSLSTGATDIKHDMVTIGILRNLTILPNNSGQTYAGSHVAYLHTIVNGGNVVEGTGASSSVATITTSEGPTTKFTSSIWYDVDNNGILEKGIDTQISDIGTMGGLQPGESMQIFIEVFPDLTTPIGTSNETTISLNVSKGVYNVNHLPVAAKDTTVTIADSVVINKSQGHAKNPGIFNDTYTLVNQNASPGEYIFYKVVATNTGATSVTSVIIEDVIPQYTTLSEGNVPGTPGMNSKPSYQVDGGSFITAEIKPNTGGTGLIRANIGTLAPGKSATLYFNVLIDTAGN